MAAFDPILGDTKWLSMYERQEICGRSFDVRRSYLTRRIDKERLAAFVEVLSPQARACLVTPPSAFAWIPYTVLIEVDRAIAEHLWNGDVSRFGELFDESDRDDLSTVLKAFLWLAGNPMSVAKRLPGAFSKRIRPVSAEWDRLGTSGGVFSLRNGALPYYNCEYGVHRLPATIIGITGGKDVQHRQITCVHRGDEKCSWELTWK